MNLGALSARSGQARGTGNGGLTGRINISNTNGNINTTSLNTSGNTNGDGGNINVTATTGNISVAGATNGTTQVYGYQTSAAAGNVGVITAKALTVTAVTDTKVYDGNSTSAGAPNVVGLVGGDTGSFTQTYDNKNAATGKAITAAGTITDGNGGNNYAVTYVADNTGVITAKALTVTAVTDTKTYDGTITSTGAPTLTSGSLVGADTAAFSQNFDNKNVGTGKTLTATSTIIDGNAGNNYAVTYVASNAGEINAKTLTVVAGAGQRKPFLTADPALFAYSASGLVTGDIITGALTRNPGETVDNYAINLGSLDAGSNYSIDYTGNVFTIFAQPIVGGLDRTNPRNGAGRLGALKDEKSDLQ